MKQIKRAAAFLLVMSMAFLLVSCGDKELSAAKSSYIDFQYDNTQITPKEMAEKDKNNLSGYEKIADNGILELYLNTENTYFACYDKRTGNTWYSVAPDIMNDSAANDESRPLSQSTITVSYYHNFVPQSMDNYTYSIENKSFTIEKKEDGFKILYEMALAASAMSDIPQKMKDDRFKKFFINHENLTENNKIRIEKYYKYDDKEKCWKFIETEEKVPNMVKIMNNVGYTKAELEKDNKAFGIKEDPNKVFFKVPLEVTIKGDSFIAEVNAKEMQYNTNCPPTTISVLRGFGNAKSEQDGYIMVPDGSGALAIYNDKHTRPGIYKSRVYGMDLTIPQKTKVENDYNINLPVFGQKVGSNAFFTVIEDGDAIASINVIRAGQMNSYNSVFSEFTISEVQQISVGESGKLTALVSKKSYKGNIRMRYAFLKENDADYSGMAGYYRSYLKKQNNLDKTVSDFSLNVNLIGAIDKKKSILGIEYTGLEALTTFDEAEKISKILQDNGISNLNIKYTGWMNNGVNQYSPVKFDVLSVLGGRKGFGSFNSFAKAQKINVFYDVTAVKITSETNRFNKFSDSAKSLNNGFAKAYEYGQITEYQDRTLHISSLNYLDKLTGSIVQNAKKAGAQRLSFSDLASCLYSDFGNNQYPTRQDAKNVYKYNLDRFNKEMAGGIKDNANAYAIYSGDIITNAPLFSNNMKVFDETIPFFSMVMHGVVKYTGQPLNYATDLRYQVLKCIENGAEPYFTMMYADSSVVKNSEYTYLFSNNFKLWEKRIIEIYNEMNSVLKEVRRETIVKHHKSGDGIYKTEYSNGKVIVVDYNKMEYSISGGGIR